LNFFKFDDINNLTHLYLEAPLEIFGHADQITMNKLNMFIMDTKILVSKLILVSKEIDKGIPATNFFFI
jgi:hypothetical protein